MPTAMENAKAHNVVPSHAIGDEAPPVFVMWCTLYLSPGVGTGTGGMLIIFLPGCDLEGAHLSAWRPVVTGN